MKKILLVGQPNVGKSSILRALTGAHVAISNYPGTTVDVYHGRARMGDEDYEIIDTPGIYNLYPSTMEEEVSELAVLEADYDAIVQVLDATALERSLLLTVALSELGVPLLLAINFWEEAEERGIRIDYGKLEELVDAPVVPVNPYRKGGVSELAKRLREARKPSIIVRYDDDIEEAIRDVERTLPQPHVLSKRGVTVRLLEEDPVVTRLYPCERIGEACRRLVIKGHEPQADIEATRAGYALRMASQVTSISAGRERIRSLHVMDRLVLSNTIAGVSMILGLLLLIVVVVIYSGGIIQDAILALAGPPVDAAIAASGSFGSLVREVVSDSLEGLLGQYAVAVPYVFIFYLILAALEDSGILSRAIVILNTMMSRMGLSAKAVIPMLLGLGCSVPAIRSTRLLPDREQKTRTTLMISMIPCSSRAAIIFGLIGHGLGVWWALSVYVLGFGLAFILAAISRGTSTRGMVFLVEDLPPYRIPRAGGVAAKSWWRLLDFLILVTPLVIVGGIAYAVISYYGLVNMLAAPFEALVASWLGLPPLAAIPLLYGFLQKDLTIAMLASVLGTANFATALTAKQIYVFGLASTFQVPCIIAFGALVKELGWRRTLSIEAVSLFTGLFVSGIALRLLP